MCIKEPFIMIDWGSALGRLQTMYIENVVKRFDNFSNNLKIKSQVVVDFKK